MPDMDFFTVTDINNSIERINKLFDCMIFKQENSQHILFRAAFIELLIAIRDLMAKTEKYSERISFDDDVKKTEKVKDVTDLIKFVRDAICHPDSSNNYIEIGNIKSTFNVAFGKCNIMKIGDFEQSSNYPDDICFFFGPHGIYLNRHIIRSFTESKQKLLPILAANSRILGFPPRT